MSDVIERLSGVVAADRLLSGDDVGEDYGHDECLTVDAVRPDAVVLPETTAEVSDILRIAQELRIPVTARGAGTGLSGAATPERGGLVVSFERMAKVLEIDTENHVAVVQPGVRLADLD